MWAIVIILVVGGIWYVVSRTSSPAATPADTVAPAASVQQGNTNSGSSDASLTQDLSAIDAQVQAASSAGVSAQTFSDTQVAQTE